MTVAEVQQTTRQTAEGVKTCRSVLDLARAHDVYVPITEAVVRVCHEGESAARMVREIMSREAKPE
jgi:glycerol-3-phosphate dehydrogenase (NAD(P)+)